MVDESGPIEAAAERAATVLATAAVTAAKTLEINSRQDHDAVIRLQGALESQGLLNATNHATLLLTITEVKDAVLLQNGRVGKLETWKTQQTAIYAAILFAAPFIFAVLSFGLNKVFG